MSRISRPEVFPQLRVLKICSKFTGEHPCRRAISVKLQSNFIEIALLHGCSPVNLLHIFRTPCPRNTSGWLLLNKSYLIHLNSLNTRREIWRQSLSFEKFLTNIRYIDLLLIITSNKYSTGRVQ